MAANKFTPIKIICDECGVEFLGVSTNRKYCKNCKPKIMKKQIEDAYKRRGKGIGNQ